MPRWSIVVPLYQERNRIEATVRRLVDSPLHAEDVELLFVDDGSADDTVAVLQRALATTGLAGRVLALPVNRGKGAAVRTGVLASTGDVVAFVDADLSSPPSAVLECLHAVEAGAQVAVASRGHASSDITARQPGGREAAGKSFNRLARLLGLTDLPDTQCGLKAFDRASALALFRPLTTRRFAFDVELLARAERLGLRVQVLPTQWAHVEQSRVSPVRDGARMAWDAARIARVLRRPARSGATSADGRLGTTPTSSGMSAETFEVMSLLERQHWWFEAKRTLVREHLAAVTEASERDRAVDVGCGTGAVLAELAALGFGEVVGTDIDPHALRLTAARPDRGVRVVGAAAENLPFRTASAGVVTSLDVVEHLRDDVLALREYFRILRPGGHLLLTVPAYMWAWSEHDDELGHQRRYVRSELEEVVTAAGFTDVQARYFHSWLVPVALVARRTPLRAFVAKRDAESVSMGRPWQNRLGHRLARADRARPAPFGLSLFLTARRPDA